MNNSDIRILVDLDDTMIDLLGHWVAEINKQYGTRVDTDDIVSWEIEKFFPSLTHEQVFKPVYTCEFWSEVKPKEKAALFIRKLLNDGYNLFVCTNTDYRVLKSKIENVLLKYFNFISWDDVIVTKHKQIIDADILIDDAVHNLIGGKYRGILMDAPHNRDFDEKSYDIVRAKNWEEVYETIQKIIKEKE